MDGKLQHRFQRTRGTRREPCHPDIWL